MAQEKEIEKKNMLTSAEFEALCQHFNLRDNDFFWQANTYYDSPDFALKNKGAALRIREKNGTFELTLKEPADEGLLETNQALSSEEAKLLQEKIQFPTGQVKEQLTVSLHIVPENLSPLGTLQTKRAHTPYHAGTIFLDHSTYLDTEDFELEIEGPSVQEVEQWMNEILTDHGIPARTAENKIKRFFTRKQQLS